MKRHCVDCCYYDDGVRASEYGTEYNEPSCGLGNVIRGTAQDEKKWGCNISEESFQKKINKKKQSIYEDSIYWHIAGLTQDLEFSVLGEIIKKARENEYFDVGSAATLVYESGIIFDADEDKKLEFRKKAEDFDKEWVQKYAQKCSEVEE